MCKQLVSQSNLQINLIQEYVDKQKASGEKLANYLEYTVNPKVERKWKQTKMEKYIYCNNPFVQDVANKQLSALQSLMYALHKQSTSVLRDYNALETNAALKLTEPKTIQELIDLTKLLEKKHDIHNEHIKEIIYITNRLTGSKKVIFF